MFFVLFLIFNSIIFFLKSTNLVDDFIYKRLPDFYTNYPSQEDLYALFKLGAKLYRRDVSSVIDLYQPLPLSSMRKRHARKAVKNNVLFGEEENLSEFWNLLTEVLQSQHGVGPVHSLSQINKLRHIFPENINIGTIDKIYIDNQTNYYTLNVKLFNDMTNLGHVYIIKSKDREEIINLENKTKNE